MPAPPEIRIYALAYDGARLRHFGAIEREHDHPDFDSCPHPDCALARKMFLTHLVRSTVAALGAPARTEAWQDIETAPKDGTRILIVTPRGDVVIARWSEEAGFDRCERRPGWQVFESEDCWYSWAEEVAMGWMPLPDPPAGSRSPLAPPSPQEPTP